MYKPNTSIGNVRESQRGDQSGGMQVKLSYIESVLLYDMYLI